MMNGIVIDEMDDDIFYFFYGWLEHHGQLLQLSEDDRRKNKDEK
jgi:hypothetical protein